jgi:hypothetical protein
VAREAGYAHACAVGNAGLGPGWDPFALPRLTIRQSTRLATFAQIVHRKNESRIFFKDRSLTKGWAMVRRTRAVLGGVSRGL